MPRLVWEETEIHNNRPRLKRADERPKPSPYRLLVEDEARRITSKGGINDNLLVHGDNLDALRALLPYYAGQVKCIFIDPPYNTGSAFTHYDDGIEHSAWLSMMRPRLKLLKEFLRPDGSLWATIDDNEAHYLKVLMDEVFGRTNFVANVIWEKSDSPRMDEHYISVRHDHLLTFAKNKEVLTLAKLKSDLAPEHYDKVDDAGRQYYLKPLRAMGGQGDTRAARPNLYFSIEAPDKTPVYPKKQDGVDGAWRWSSEKVEEEISRIEWRGNKENGWTPYYRIYADKQIGRPPETIWFHADVGSNRTSKAEAKALAVGNEPFGTPKPERLLQRVIHIATNPGDIILDSFLGSGTTAAVAHKMGRRWIGIEMGEHAHTHCLPRLKKVVDGEQGGISEAVNWRGGGGFRYYSLGEPVLLESGEINPAVRFAPLAAHVWFAETGTPWPGQDKKSPLLGVHGKRAYALFYNGVWGEEVAANTLSPSSLAKLKAKLPDFDGEWVIYAHYVEQLSEARRTAARVLFRQLPKTVRGSA